MNSVGELVDFLLTLPRELGVLLVLEDCAQSSACGDMTAAVCTEEGLELIAEYL